MHPSLPSKKLIAIYDMDKTITVRATYGGFLAHMVRNRALWRIVLLPVLPLGLIRYVTKYWTRAQLKEFAHKLFIGQHSDWRTILPLVETYADTVWLNGVYPQSRARILEEKTLGYDHVLATASYMIYASAIGARLGFRHTVATELELNSSGVLHAKIRGENCYGAAKLVMVKHWLAEQGLNRADCHIRAYSDHVSDAPLLEFADEAFATNPHPPLEQIAQERGWTILDWR